jgi:hypothetical protein
MVVVRHVVLLMERISKCLVSVTGVPQVVLCSVGAESHRRGEECMSVLKTACFKLADRGVEVRLYSVCGDGINI